jgi:hypothetical protein
MCDFIFFGCNFSGFQASVLDKTADFSNLLVIMNNEITQISCLSVQQVFCRPSSITMVIEVKKIF